MKKCWICNRKIIEEDNDEVCGICGEFFKWKYEDNFQEQLEQIKKLKKRDIKFGLIKLRRKK
ncbi:MAG: hypothetical protein KJ646_00770 [Nanoarchaeota archaeon]|nr:hypothetical protein [Nanoarchaeota archaeon]